MGPRRVGGRGGGRGGGSSGRGRGRGQGRAMGRDNMGWHSDVVVGERDEGAGGAEALLQAGALVPAKRLRTSNKNKGLVVSFDEEARREFVTGFRKRKDVRRKEALEKQAHKARQKKLLERAERRQAVRQARGEPADGSHAEDDEADGDGGEGGERVQWDVKDMQEGGLLTASHFATAPLPNAGAIVQVFEGDDTETVVRISTGLEDEEEDEEGGGEDEQRSDAGGDAAGVDGWRREREGQQSGSKSHATSPRHDHAGQGNRGGKTSVKKLKSGKVGLQKRSFKTKSRGGKGKGSGRGTTRGKGKGKGRGRGSS